MQKTRGGKAMKRNEKAESIARVHTHTHTPYVYRIGGQSGERATL